MWKGKMGNRRKREVEGERRIDQRIVSAAGGRAEMEIGRAHV